MTARQDRRADFRDLRLLIDRFDEGSVRTPEERTKLGRRALRLAREAAWHAVRAARILSLLNGSNPDFTGNVPSASESLVSDEDEEVAK
jgi:hypothetical protein